MTHVIKILVGLVSVACTCAVVGFLSALAYVIALAFPYIPSPAELVRALSFVGTIVAAVSATSGVVLFVTFGLPLHIVLIRLNKTGLRYYMLSGLATASVCCLVFVLVVHANLLRLEWTDLMLAVCVALLSGPLAEVSFWKIVRPDRFATGPK